LVLEANISVFPEGFYGSCLFDLFIYLSQNEKWSPPADHHNTAGQFDPTLHSTKGLVSVSLNGFAYVPEIW
jgi:hypothetical protein